uniref:Uncharacterized protein n=1 Tax=Rhizophora mucronata TaxID=61149 RepID=A0A2P2QZD4_RHIMU
MNTLPVYMSAHFECTSFYMCKLVHLTSINKRRAIRRIFSAVTSFL